MPERIEGFRLFQDLSVGIVAGVLVAIIFPILLFFKNLPRVLLQKMHEKRNEVQIKKIVKMRMILYNLVRECGGIYAIVVKYHDTDKPINVKSKLNMTIVWEEPNNKCSECELDSNFKVKRLQGKWQETPVIGNWINVICDTIEKKERINTVERVYLDIANQELWDASHINMYKEIHLRDVNDGIYALGVCFCKDGKRKYSNGHIALASNQLKKLL